MKAAAQRQPVKTSGAPFDACIIVYNPRSTQAEQAQQRIERLKKLFSPDAVTLLQLGPDADANRALFCEQAARLGSRTLVAIGGGDGTVNFLVDTLLHSLHLAPDQRRAVVLPLWGGNGNDLAYMLNGSPSRLSVDRLLQTGASVAIYPLRCVITANGTTTNYTAVCYASFGASAFAAQQLETRRGSRPLFHTIGIAKFMHELGMVLGAMLRAPLITMEDDAKTRPVYDRYFLNGPRLAKISYGPLKLTKPEFYAVTVEQKRASLFAFHGTELRTHPERYAVTSEQTIAFTLQEPTWAQLDGEVMRLTAGTRVGVSLHEQPFYALSTLLHS